jgi:hypothetical protein
MTKVPPAKPIHARKMTKPLAVWTKPVHAVGMEAPQSTIENKTLAPYLSQRGPRINLIKIVPPTPAIDEFQTSCFVRPKDFWISERSGEIANQMKNAIKKDHLDDNSR